jgi:hypothetical protein
MFDFQVAADVAMANDVLTRVVTGLIFVLTNISRHEYPLYAS